MQDSRISIILVLALLVPATVGAQAGRGTARIACPNSLWDFGKQPQYTQLKYEFLIRNEGDGELEIQQVRPSCQCQAAMPDKRKLAPGEETTIKVSFDTKNMSGPIHKPITVQCNDPTHPLFQLVVRGTILPPYWLDPPEVNLGSVSKNEGAGPQEFSVIISPKAKVGIRSVTTTNELVTVQLVTREPIVRDDGMRELRYRVGLKPGHPVGLVRERVTITTDLPYKRVANLGVSAEVKGEVRVRPPTVRLGRIKPGQTPSRNVDIIKSGMPDLKIQKLIIKPARAREVFTAELETVEEGRHYRVKISVKAEAPSRYQRGHVVIMTNCLGERLHQAYFYVSVKK